MRNLAALAGAIVFALGAQTAFAYGGTANLTFTFGGSAAGSGTDQGFVTSSGGLIVPGVANNNTMFSTLGGANSLSYYNQDFASVAQCTPGGGVVPPAFTVTTTRKYGCRVGTSIPTSFIRTPVVDTGPVGQASGSLTVTDSTLSGTLTIVSTTDEPQGATTTFANGVRVSNSIGDGLNGYNYRSGDGSPFGNVWYGVTTTGTLAVNLTGTFTASTWSITGGSVTFADSNFACQQGGLGGGAEGTLCTVSTTGGGFSVLGSHLSWGMDPDGSATGAGVNMIDVRDIGGGATVATLSGVLASLSLDGSGNITSGTGEFRRASGSASAGCPTHIRYDTGTNTLVCGSIAAGNLAITGGVVVPVPMAGFLMASALGLLGWIRRRASITAR